MAFRYWIRVVHKGPWHLQGRSNNRVALCGEGLAAQTNFRKNAPRIVERCQRCHTQYRAGA